MCIKGQLLLTSALYTRVVKDYVFYAARTQCYSWDCGPTGHKPVTLDDDQLLSCIIWLLTNKSAI